MDSLHALGYDHIPTAYVHRPPPDTLASLFNDPTHAARPYKYVTLDRIRSQIVLRTEDGCTRALTDCKTAQHLERLLPLAATLTSLILAGVHARNIAGLPVFPALITSTIVIHSSDSPPSAMTKSWNCPQLKTLKLSSIKNVESIPVALVADFISTKLAPARTLAELRLDSVKLVTTSDVCDTDPGATLASLVDSIISTTAILEGAKVEKYGP
ncbi:hypothetical protein EXIGLDRAFT_832742 [Exidia glandulosa HHB12029]|uniref:Uncharacterized protein n=1 Tax=Exidia glandulosa HHB12029 TaxID=1314781 RepID=A0A165LAQ8_EXIGL|nr:hypothetical protein EXIGLDRAFT_832742 [Exidia glandulosa HHB12029]